MHLCRLQSRLEVDTNDIHNEAVEGQKLFDDFIAEGGRWYCAELWSQRRLKHYSIFKITRMSSMIPIYNLHYDNVWGNFLRPPHGTTPLSTGILYVKCYKNSKFHSVYSISETEDKENIKSAAKI